MGSFLSYMLQVSVIMTLLYLGYKWLRSGSTLHLFNRMTLCSILIFSWIFPALLPLFRPTPVADINLNLPVPLLAAASPSASQPQSLSFADIAVAIYLIGALIVLIFTVIAALRMARIICSGSSSPLGHLRITITDKAPGPFSWGRHIILRNEDCDADEEMVIAHEREHLRNLHWVDLLVARLAVVLQWYSPVAWLITRELRQVHEFQVDKAMEKHGLRRYQYMLLKKTVGSSFPTFADSLNHSQLKTRLTMMLKKQSKPSRMWAAMALPAALTLGAFILTMPAVADALGSVSNADTSRLFSRKVNQSPAPEQIPVATPTAQQSTTPADVQAPAVSPEASVATAPSASEKPNEEPEKAEKAVEIAIFVDGKPMTAAESKSISPESIEAIQIVKNDPDYPQGKMLITLKKPDSSRPAYAVEELATFKGGQQAMMDYLSQNIKMPEGIKLTKKERVIVMFTVETDGSIKNAKVVKGAAPALDKEALRVVNGMSGKWNPAINNGQPVASSFTLPINFSQK